MLRWTAIALVLMGALAFAFWRQGEEEPAGSDSPPQVTEAPPAEEAATSPPPKPSGGGGGFMEAIFPTDPRPKESELLSKFKPVRVETNASLRGRITGLDGATPVLFMHSERSRASISVASDGSFFVSSILAGEWTLDLDGDWEFDPPVVLDLEAGTTVEGLELPARRP